jgi:hypothetical protein
VIRGAVREVEAEWAELLGSAELEELRTLLRRLVAGIEVTRAVS